MSISRTFNVLDEQGGKHVVVVHETPHKTTTGTRMIKDYSLEETGEMLNPEAGTTGAWKGSSTGRRFTEA